MSESMLSVVIPAWNEENGIVQIVERVRATRPALHNLGLDLEIVVVDDGSRDRTATLAAQCGDTRVIRHLVNRGYGAALKTGFRHAQGQILAFLDADGTYPPDALPEMYQALLAQDADIIVGSRMSGAASEMPVTRRVGNFAFAQMLSILSGVRVQDSASGMRMFKRQALIKLYPLPDGLNFTPAMTTRALNEDIKIVEVPISYAERIGRSKLSVVRDGVRFTNTIVWTTMTYRPVRVWGGIGLAMGAVSAVLAVLLIVDWLTGGTFLGALAPLAAFGMMVFGVLGASIFSLGVMFSYLIAIFTHKPVRRGMFGRVIFDPPLDHYFGRIGVLAALSGLLISATSLVLIPLGWSFTQLWIWLLLGALLIVVGAQLGMTYLVIRVLDELAQREASAQRDLVDAEDESQVAIIGPIAPDAATVGNV